jgi:putative hydrolase of the HAD superfamily
VIEVIGFDGDDTLWHNETVFSLTQARFRELLAPHVSGDDVDRRLFETERRNLTLFGYGVKGFTLSMIETAIELTDGRLSGSEVRSILDAGKAMLDHPVELLEGVRDCIRAVAPGRTVLLVTKGDLFDQESKLARSGLAEEFDGVEVVSEKDEATYRRVLARHGADPSTFLMVGNSLRSDVLPAVGIGARAVHVPYEITWAHEVVDAPPGEGQRWWTAPHLGEVCGIVERLERLEGPSGR